MGILASIKLTYRLGDIVISVTKDIFESSAIKINPYSTWRPKAIHVGRLLECALERQKSHVAVLPFGCRSIRFSSIYFFPPVLTFRGIPLYYCVRIRVSINTWVPAYILLTGATESMAVRCFSSGLSRKIVPKIQVFLFHTDVSEYHRLAAPFTIHGNIITQSAIENLDLGPDPNKP